MNALDAERAFHKGWKAWMDGRSPPDCERQTIIGYAWGKWRCEQYARTPPWYEREETRGAIKSKGKP